MNPEVLNQLRDIHLPPAVGWWPPAPGWWILAGLAVAAIYLWRRLRKRRRRITLEAAARDEVTRLWADYQRDRDTHALASGLSRVLKRVALARFPRENVAGLSGDAWLAFLERHAPAGGFTQHAGRLLLDAAYRPDSVVDSEALVWLARQWIGPTS